jgi:DNA-binding protein H-NS
VVAEGEDLRISGMTPWSFDLIRSPDLPGELSRPKYHELNDEHRIPRSPCATRSTGKVDWTLRNAERGDAIEWIRQQMALFDVKPEDLDPRRGRSSKKQSGPVAAKFRDPASGATWSGRGKPPRRIAEQDREKFAITDLPSPVPAATTLSTNL